MRKLKRLHVAVALLAVASFVSLLGVSLVGGTDGLTLVKIKSATIVQPRVWWEEVPRGIIWWLPKVSGFYSSWGRSMLHLMWVAEGLAAGETIEVKVYGRLFKPDMSTAKNFVAYTHTLTDTNPTYETVMYVPSKSFYFTAHGPSTSTISLNIYLSGN